MKAISLSRPWPFTFLNLGKRLENRKRKDGRIPSICKHRGPVLLHAAQSWDKGGYALVLSHIEPLDHPVECAGMLGLWTVPEDVLTQAGIFGAA